jgi:predicted phosphoribosyltransferase
VFSDRRQAGRQLAAALKRLKLENPIVLALPRGGVPVAFEVARALGAPLDVVMVRKIGAPGHAELGLGAVVDGADPQLVLNDDIVRLLAPDPAYVEAETLRQLKEIERRKRLYRGERRPVAIEGRVVIVIDDGIATGGTVKAVLRALTQAKPSRRVLAVPVAPKESIDTLAPEADDVVCLAMPEPFFAVGTHYRDFRQTSDAEVVDLLRRSAEAQDSG